MPAHHHDNSDLTKNQALVYDTLNAADGPLSAYTILDQLREAGFRAPLQVYRALERLQALGLVHRLESLNAFVACAGHECHRRGLIAFAICSDCGSVEEFSDKVLGDRLDGWAEQAGFHSRSATVELRGTCASCATTH